MHYAASDGIDECIKALLEFKANINMVRKGSCAPIHVAINYGHLNIVEFLINNGANINQQTASGETPLHVAARKSKMDILDYLLKQDADPTITDKNDETPIYAAINTGNQEAVEIFLRRNFDPTIVNRQGQTALHVAAKVGNQAIARKIVDCGAKIDSVDVYYNTALHYATIADSGEIVNMLLSHQADATIRNIKGKSPFFYASERTARIYRQHFQNDAALTALTQAALEDRPQHRAIVHREVKSSIPPPPKKKKSASDEYQRMVDPREAAKREELLRKEAKKNANRPSSPQKKAVVNDFPTYQKVANTPPRPAKRTTRYPTVSAPGTNILEPNNRGSEGLVTSVEFNQFRGDVQKQLDGLKQTMDSQMGAMLAMVSDLKRSLQK